MLLVTHFIGRFKSNIPDLARVVEIRALNFFHQKRILRSSSTQFLSLEAPIFFWFKCHISLFFQPLQILHVWHHICCSWRYWKKKLFVKWTQKRRRTWDIHSPLKFPSGPTILFVLKCDRSSLCVSQGLPCCCTKLQKNHFVASVYFDLLGKSGNPFSLNPFASGQDQLLNAFVMLMASWTR